MNSIEKDTLSKIRDITRTYELTEVEMVRRIRGLLIDYTIQWSRQDYQERTLGNHSAYREALARYNLAIKTVGPTGPLVEQADPKVTGPSW